MFASTASAERGDQIFSVNVADAIARQAAAGIEPADPDRASDATPWARASGQHSMANSSDVSCPRWPPACFCDQSVSERSERAGRIRDLFSRSHSRFAGSGRRASLRTMKRSNRTYAGTTTAATFSFRSTMVPWKGSTRIRKLGSTGWMPTAAMFSAGRRISPGQVAHYAVASDGGVLAAAGSGPKSRCIPRPGPGRHFRQQRDWPARTNWSHAAAHSSRIAFVHSSLGKPAEVYLADSAGQTADRSASHRIQQAVHRTRSAPGQTLSLEGGGRHHGRRHADVSAGKV